MYWIIVIALMIVSYAVSSKLKRKFKKYSQVPLASGLSGREIAEAMLLDHGIRDVQIISVDGQLTDHYNPSNKTVNLSPEVFGGRSAASAAIAAHECGHAVQHAKAYSMLELRSVMVPIQNISSKILNIVIMIAFFGGIFAMGLPYESIILVIIACFTVLTLFSLVTLPVEFDASKRALAWVEQRRVVTDAEHDMARDALKWAAMTYIVGAIGSLVMLLYYVSILLGRD